MLLYLHHRRWLVPAMRATAIASRSSSYPSEDPISFLTCKFLPPPPVPSFVPDKPRGPGHLGLDRTVTGIVRMLVIQDPDGRGPRRDWSNRFRR